MGILLTPVFVILVKSAMNSEQNKNEFWTEEILTWLHSFYRSGEMFDGSTNATEAGAGCSEKVSDER